MLLQAGLFPKYCIELHKKGDKMLRVGEQCQTCHG